MSAVILYGATSINYQYTTNNWSHEVWSQQIDCSFWKKINPLAFNPLALQ